MIGGTMEE